MWKMLCEKTISKEKEQGINIPTLCLISSASVIHSYLIIYICTLRIQGFGNKLPTSKFI
jgi:hypothetical protein